MIQWHEDFQSSNVQRIGYDSENREVLVTFKDKAGNPTSTWGYSPVDRADFDAIHTAPSVGSAVNKGLVRSGAYSSRKVE